MKADKKEAGLSVMEVIISTLIMVLLLSVASQILFWGLNVSRKEKGLAFIRSESAKSITWLIKDLRRTSIQSIYMTDYPVPDTPIAISLLSPIGDDAIGSESTVAMPSPKWKCFVVYYLKPDPDNTATLETSQKYLLYRKTYFNSAYKDAFNPDMSMPEQLDAIDFLGLCNEMLTGDTKRVVARNIYELTIPEINIPDNYCTISVETRQKGDPQEIKSVYTTKVIMRNTLHQPK